MALDGTYSGLQGAVADFLNRADLTVSIPSFITLAESQMNRKLHVNDMWFVRTVNLTAETLKLPCDFTSIESFRLNQSTDGTAEGGKLTYRTPQQMDQLPVGFSGVPRHYTIAGGCFVFWPIPVAPIAPAPAIQARIRGRERIPALSVSNPTNWLLTKHPDAYLYGSLLQSAPYVKDDARIQVWDGLFSQILADIESDDARLVSDALQTVSGVSDGLRNRNGYGYGGNPF